MEPISYLGAPIRRWPVIVVIALVAMIVAILIPVSASSAYPANTWMATAQVGLTPPYSHNQLGAKLGPKQLVFYAHSPVVLATAAKTAGVPLSKGMKNDVIVTKSKVPGTHSSVLELAVLQPTKARAVDLTNALVTALGSYAQVQLAANHAHSLFVEGLYIQNLQNTINSLPKKLPKTPTTTPTTAPVKIKRVVVRPATPTTAPATTTTTTTAAHSAAAPHQGNAALASFTASSDRTTSARGSGGTTFTLVATVDTTPTTLPGLTTSNTATTLPAGTSGTSGASAALPTRAVVLEQKVLADELGAALGFQQNLKAQGVPKTGYRVISPSQQSSAVRLNPNPPLLANVWIRLLLGLLLGALIGLLATWLLDGFDRRLRTTRRAEEVFGLPVVAEIPAAGTGSLSVIPVVDVIVDPFSATSEAYRNLHVAILTAPAVTWVKRGLGQDRWDVPAPQPQPLLVGAPAGPDATRTQPVTAPTGNADDTLVFGEPPYDAGREPGSATKHLPVAVMPPQIAVPRRSRFSILVTSPNDEPTRSLVVVNLAAVFAEAGDRVLVATTGGMRTEFEGNGRGPHAWTPEMEDADASDLIANARPSQIPGVSSLALRNVFSSPSRLALKAGSLVEAAADIVDVLLLEAPLLSTQDGPALLPFVDLVVVVCEAWHTTISEARRTQSLLAQRRPPVLGLVMTNMPNAHPLLQ